MRSSNVSVMKSEWWKPTGLGIRAIHSLFRRNIRMEKQIAREHFAFARQQKRFPREHFTFARQQKRFPREHFTFAHQQKRFPREHFTFARQQKRFPREHFTFARQQKRFPREHFTFARQQKRFPRCRSTQPPQPGGARSRKFSLYAAAGNSFHRSAITPRRFNAGMVPPASPSQLVPSSGA